MRTIHIPAPTHTARLIVRKRLDQHMTGDRLISGRRGSACLLLALCSRRSRSSTTPLSQGTSPSG